MKSSLSLLVIQTPALQEKKKFSPREWSALIFLNYSLSYENLNTGNVPLQFVTYYISNVDYPSRVHSSMTVQSEKKCVKTSWFMFTRTA